MTTWDVMTFVIGTLVTLSLSVVHPLSLGVRVVVYGRRMWSSQRVAANHKSIPWRTVNHWQAICSLGLNVPDDKDAAICKSSGRLQCVSHTLLKQVPC